MREEKIEVITKKVGNIIIPIIRTDNALCVRFALCSGTDAKGKVWHVSYSGGCVVIDVPQKHRHYSIKFEDILKEVVLKEND